VCGFGQLLEAFLLNPIALIINTALLLPGYLFRSGRATGLLLPNIKIIVRTKSNTDKHHAFRDLMRHPTHSPSLHWVRYLYTGMRPCCRQARAHYAMLSISLSSTCSSVLFSSRSLSGGNGCKSASLRAPEFILSALTALKRLPTVLPILLARPMLLRALPLPRCMVTFSGVLSCTGLLKGTLLCRPITDILPMPSRGAGVIGLLATSLPPVTLPGLPYLRLRR
jgi:hypothetical protein